MTSIQAAIVEVLQKKTLRAAKRERVGCITLSGGVACNRSLRQRFQGACEHAGIQLRLAPAVLCTDNAAMIGLLAEKQLELGAEPAGLAEYIRPTWPITGC